MTAPDMLSSSPVGDWKDKWEHIRLCSGSSIGILKLLKIYCLHMEKNYIDSISGLWGWWAKGVKVVKGTNSQLQGKPGVGDVCVAWRP